jgi:hypothetical protein
MIKHTQVRFSGETKVAFPQGMSKAGNVMLMLFIQISRGFRLKQIIEISAR